MRLVIEFLVFSAFFQQTGVALRCYSCYSKENWTQCDQEEERVLCAPWLDVCAKTHVSFETRGKKIEVFERGCFADNLCTPKACKYIGRHFNAKDCNITCCDLELCNGGTLPSNSMILVGVTVVVAAVNSIWCLLCRHSIRFK